MSLDFSADYRTPLPYVDLLKRLNNCILFYIADLEFLLVEARERNEDFSFVEAKFDEFYGSVGH
jgi:hypothetical protein